MFLLGSSLWTEQFCSFNPKTAKTANPPFMAENHGFADFLVFDKPRIFSFLLEISTGNHLWPNEKPLA